MKNLKKEVLFLPDYVKEFECTMCGDCCRSKWNIDVDERTHKRLEKKFAELGRSDDFTEMIELSAQGRSMMKFDAAGRCMALASDGRCKIQLELGYEYLSDVCKTYPRYIRVTPRGIEISLSFSCPAAAKLLRRKDPVGFSYLPVDDPSFFFMKAGITDYFIPGKLPKNDIKRHYFPIEAGLIRVMQDRDFSIGERLVLLGHMLGRLASLDVEKTDEEQIVAMLTSYRGRVEIGANYELHLQTLRWIFDPVVEGNEEVKNAMAYLLKILATDEKMSCADFARLIKKEPSEIVLLPQKYYEMLRKYYEPSLNEISHVLENYFVNQIFLKTFYYMEWQEAFFKISLMHAMIQFYAIALSVSMKKATTEEIVIQAIVETENYFSHAGKYCSNLWQAIKEKSGVERHDLVFNLAKG